MLLGALAFPVLLTVGLDALMGVFDPAQQASAAAPTSDALSEAVRAMEATAHHWDQQSVTATDLLLWPLIGLIAFWVVGVVLRVFAGLKRVYAFDAEGTGR